MSVVLPVAITPTSMRVIVSLPGVSAIFMRFWFIVLLSVVITGRLSLLPRRLIIPAILLAAIVVGTRRPAAATTSTEIAFALPKVTWIHVTLCANLFVHCITPCTAVLLTKFAYQICNSTPVG